MLQVLAVCGGTDGDRVSNERNSFVVGTGSLWGNDGDDLQTCLMRLVVGTGSLWGNDGIS